MKTLPGSETQEGLFILPLNFTGFIQKNVLTTKTRVYSGKATETLEEVEARKHVSFSQLNGGLTITAERAALECVAAAAALHIVHEAHVKFTTGSDACVSQTAVPDITRGKIKSRLCLEMQSLDLSVRVRFDT